MAAMEIKKENADSDQSRYDQQPSTALGPTGVTIPAKDVLTHNVLLQLVLPASLFKDASKTTCKTTRRGFDLGFE
jgi:hypothetical protein